MGEVSRVGCQKGSVNWLPDTILFQALDDRSLNGCMAGACLCTFRGRTTWIIPYRKCSHGAGVL